MAENDSEVFDIHLFAIKRQIQLWFSNGKRVDFAEFEAKANETFNGIYQDTSNRVLVDVFQWLADREIFSTIDNKYADTIYFFDGNRHSSISHGGNFSQQYSRVASATDREYADKWLLQAMENSLGDVVVNENGPQIASMLEDAWQPLPIDRETEEYTAAVNVTKEAIEAIRSDNGYAESQPGERNAILNISKGTLEAIEEGTPSKGQVDEGLVKPLIYLAKKFADTAIGIAAKKAFEAILIWLAAIL